MQRNTLDFHVTSSVFVLQVYDLSEIKNTNLFSPKFGATQAVRPKHTQIKHRTLSSKACQIGARV